MSQLMISLTAHGLGARLKRESDAGAGHHIQDHAGKDEGQHARRRARQRQQHHDTDHRAGHRACGKQPGRTVQNAEVAEVQRQHRAEGRHGGNAENARISQGIARVALQRRAAHAQGQRPWHDREDGARQPQFER